MLNTVDLMTVLAPTTSKTALQLVWTRSDGLDWLISEAPKYGLRLVLVLTDSQDGYGGMRQYVRWAGASVKTLRDFYRSRSVRV